MPREATPRKWTAFQILLRNQAAERGLTARDVQAASGIQPGTVDTPMVNASTWSRLTTKTWTQPPDAKTLEGLARALRIDINQIKVAVLETMGIDLPMAVPTTPIQLSAVEADGLEDPEARGHISWVLRKLLEASQMDAVLRLERKGELEVDRRSRELYEKHGDLAVEILDLLVQTDEGALSRAIDFVSTELEGEGDAG